MTAQAVLLLFALTLLAGCGPRLKGEAIAGRTIMITNEEQQTVTISRVVANDSDGRSECVDTPGAALGPGRTYTVTFFYCEEVHEIDVETDQGTRAIAFD
jgi:hypothetical protein